MNELKERENRSELKNFLTKVRAMVGSHKRQRPYVIKGASVRRGVEAEAGNGSELKDFLNKVIAQQEEAEKAMHNGDPGPWMRLWSRKEPVTYFGAWGMHRKGWDDVSRAIRWLASRFSKCSEFGFGLVAADVCGDMAYTAGYESSLVCIEGGTPVSETLRVTQVYRREKGEWKIVYRHSDLSSRAERLRDVVVASPPIGDRAGIATLAVRG